MRRRPSLDHRPQYQVLEDERTGELRVVSGPTLLFLGPYEVERGELKPVTVLGANDARAVTNKATGEVRLVKGPTTFVPGV